jgi:hypothetical protein
MKNIITIIAVAISLMVPFGGCKKFVDHVLHNDTNDIEHCRIAKVFLIHEFIDSIQTGIVYYNDHNDPDSVIFDFPGSSLGPALFYFVYDADHRLIEYRADYSREPGDFYIKHTYVYSGGIIVVDTTRAQVSGSGVEVHTLQYDLNGRVVREDRKVIEIDHLPVNEDAEPFVFSYDASGNLAGDVFAYDNKVNFMRTNKVWMFTERNYSMNNRKGATSYNDHGLPLTFQEEHRPYFLNYGPIALEYDCSGK